jgi:UDP-2,3-diacylglucosamine hydrolase
VLQSPCYVLSDAHVGAAPLARRDALIAFLRQLRGKSGSLVLNGDILDFWFEWRRSVPTFAIPVLAALHELAASGMPIVWLAGNHDCWGGAVLRETIGVRYQTAALRLPFGAWDLNIEHGDGLRGHADRGYLRIKPILRHPLSVWLFKLIHPDFGTRLALGTSETSRVHSAADDGVGLQHVALGRIAADNGPTLVVFGHSHVAGLTRGARGVYANPGAWADASRYLCITDSRVELREFIPSGEDRCLDAVDYGTKNTLREPVEAVGRIGTDETVLDRHHSH